MGRCALQQDGEFGDGGFQVIGLEEGQPKVKTQAGHGWLESERLAVERHCLLVVVLTGFKQAEVSIGLGVGGMGLEEGAPGFFGFGEFALLLKGQSGLAEVRRWRLCEGGGEQKGRCECELHDPFHAFPSRLI